ncbi:MAG TPA: hypothetical protein VEX68_26385 [Bryobacteraceae bacterium]|nr:hypothetical protein [Bryobacteraceae bacterium]
MIIGHQPQLTQLADRLLEDKLPGKVLPIGGSEIACIQIQPKKELIWLLTEKPDSLLVELRAKIQSKYDVAKFFLGALVVGTGLTMNKDVWEVVHPVHKVLAGLGAVSALVSVALTAATLFSYDRLLMPTDFWNGGGHRRANRWTLRRPPSQAHVVLFYEMTYVWTQFFGRAITFAFTSLGLLAVVMAHRSLDKLPANLAISPVVWWMTLCLFLIMACMALAVPMLVYHRRKPHLGFDD